MAIITERLSERKGQGGHPKAKGQEQTHQQSSESRQDSRGRRAQARRPGIPSREDGEAGVRPGALAPSGGPGRGVLRDGGVGRAGGGWGRGGGYAHAALGLTQAGGGSYERPREWREGSRTRTGREGRPERTRE